MARSDQPARLRRPAWHRAVVPAALTAAVVLATGCAEKNPAASGSAVQAAAASCTAPRGTWTAAEPASPGSVNNDLTGVAVLGAGNAWAVGTYASGSGGQTLIEHWNGATWSVTPSPDPGGSGDFLTDVGAVSPSDVWAVGQSEIGGQSKTLIVRWNGTTWQQVASPSPGSDNYLTGVWAVSASDVWAVGDYGDEPSDSSSLILHWNGTAWTQSAAPHLKGTGGELLGVAATSAENVWAAGDVTNSAGEQSLILRWNGTGWTRAPVPDPGGRGLIDALRGVAATSPANAWAVGYITNGASYQSLIMHWNGSAWTRAASPNPGSGGDLEGIAADSSANAWAVGQFGGVGGDKAFAIRYCTQPRDKAD